jgi:uncharacterized protein YqhQ
VTSRYNKNTLTVYLKFFKKIIRNKIQENLCERKCGDLFLKITILIGIFKYSFNFISDNIWHKTFTLHF